VLTVKPGSPSLPAPEAGSTEAVGVVLAALARAGGAGAGFKSAVEVTLKIPNGLRFSRLGPIANGLKTRD
jgi:hypothetical protein